MKKCKPGSKYDGGKPRWDLVPLNAVNEVAKAMTFGAAKYDDNNWHYNKTGRKQYYAAALRHLAAAQDNYGAKDKESGLLHLAHAATCILFVIWYVLTGKGGGK